MSFLEVLILFILVTERQELPAEAYELAGELDVDLLDVKARGGGLL